ncbi:ThiF family adenylyltransferase [Specibacter sp. NPDC057265]|uniref:ThiF family adenylyltransferase n=1 Tax=Specibacter sp. NPDC057265 TaxID=3346075 RepID=UPI00362C538C
MTSINPALRMVRRSEQSVQIGVGRGGIILAGLQRADVDFLDALRAGIPDAHVLEAAEALGVSALRAQEMCIKLAGFLFSEAELTAHGHRAERLFPERSAMLGLYQGPCQELMDRREHSVVHVVGLGRTGAALAAVLAASGVGTFLLEDDGVVTATDVSPGAHRVEDIGVTRALSTRRNLQRLDPACQVHIMHDGGVGGPSVASLDLAVVVGHDAVPTHTAARFLAAEKPQLIVLLREQDGTIGPLVVPGETACPECVEWHRSGEDPQWRDICQELAQPLEPWPDRRPRHERQETMALATVLAGTAAAHALLFLDGIKRPSSWSTVLNFHPDTGAWTQQEYRAHPRCGCQWQNQPRATISSTAAP